MGNLTRDPELRQTPSGQNVTNFSLALNRAYKDKSGEWQEVTDYVDIVCWGPLAERVAQYMSKGRRCLVQGRLQSRSWEQEGQKRSKVEVQANDVTFLDGRGGGDSNDSTPVSDEPAVSEKSASKSDSKSDSKAAKPKPSNAAKAAKAKKDDVVIEDVDDEPINLDDIPF